MRQSHSWPTALLVFLCVTGGFFLFQGQPTWAIQSLSSFPASLQQQTAPTPFLLPPLYGTTGINSIFDHEYPVYGREGGLNGSTADMVHYDGRRVARPGYSGHEGIDYGLTYAPVLAATSFANTLVEAPVWSPDGAQLAFAALPSGGGVSDVWLYAPANSAVIRAMQNANTRYPVFTSDR